jgi:hypothetical protein
MFDFGIVGFVHTAFFKFEEFPKLFKKDAQVFGENAEFIIPMKKEERKKYFEEMISIA